MAGSRTVPRLATKVSSPVPSETPKAKWYHWVGGGSLLVLFIIFILLGMKVKESYDEDNDEKKKSKT